MALHYDLIAAIESVDMGRVDMSRSAEVVERRLRLASSSPDVKSLFNNPTHIYKLEDRDEPEAAATFIPGAHHDYWGAAGSGTATNATGTLPPGPPLPPIVSLNASRVSLIR